MISKPRCFNDLLELQRILDEEVSKPRDNGFIPRERNEIDILLALDDEFQEWLKELPYEYNFKTWKQKEYSREKELEEFVDVLFFFLQYVRVSYEKEPYYIEGFKRYLNRFKKGLFKTCKTIYHWVDIFKNDLWNQDIDDAFWDWLYLASVRGFNIDEILETYWKKWQTNMKRINKDWIMEGKNE